MEPAIDIDMKTAFEFRRRKLEYSSTLPGVMVKEKCLALNLGELR